MRQRAGGSTPALPVNLARVEVAPGIDHLAFLINSTNPTLMSHGADVREANRKIAVYVDKILKGAQPSEPPIDQMSKYDLIIDLQVARAIGIHVPQDLLLRADEVIR